MVDKGFQSAIFPSYIYVNEVNRMCKWDEAFTEQEMLGETGYCKDCRLDCPNAGKENSGY